MQGTLLLRSLVRMVYVGDCAPKDLLLVLADELQEGTLQSGQHCRVLLTEPAHPQR